MSHASKIAGVDGTIATTDDNGRGEHFEVPIGKLVSSNEVQIQMIYFRKNTEFYKVSWGLRTWLRRHVLEFDVVHIHALFSFSSTAAASAAQRAGVPYIVRPLGVLNRWGVENRRRMVKQLSLRFIEIPLLRSAAAIHYTAEVEREEAILSVPELKHVRSAIIPIPVELPEQSASGSGDSEVSQATNPIILYLSRLDPKKGIELLLEAFRDVVDGVPLATLVIAGSGEAEYVQALRAKAEALGIANKTKWVGFVGGNEKAELLKSATVFVLPSYSENFGIAAAEAMAAGIPTVLTDGVALGKTAAAAEAVIVVSTEAAKIAHAIELLLTSPSLRQKIGFNGRSLIETKYSSTIVGAALLRLYESVVKERKQ